VKPALKLFSILGLLLIGIGYTHPLWGEIFFPSSRVFELTYAGSFGDLPQGAQTGRFWIPLATPRAGQKILNREILLPTDYKISKEPVFENEMIYFELKKPLPRNIDFQIQYVVEASQKDFSKKAKQSKSLELYLKPSRLMAITDEVVQRTNPIIQKDQANHQNAKNIYDHVILKMVYDKKTPGWGNGDTQRACLLGKGNCTDFHSLFISMSQVAKIPARFKIGFAIPNGTEGKIAGYHCWAEFYEKGKGWRPVDASEAWKHPEMKDLYFGNFDTNKFVLTMGRDINLVPAQSGKPINIFFYPYIEIDGKEFNNYEMEFSYKELENVS